MNNYISKFTFCKYFVVIALTKQELRLQENVMVLGEQSGIEHYATGGTLDMVWSPEKDGLSTVSFSHFVKYLLFLSKLGYPEMDSEVLMQHDSKEINDVEQELIVNTVAESAAKRLMVTIGTYAMDAIGNEISEHPNMVTNSAGKVVAMVPSIIPIKGFEMSDGPFNAGMAQAALGWLKPEDGPVIGSVSGLVAPIRSMRKSLHDATYRRSGSEKNLLGYESYTLVPAGGTIDFESDGLDGVQSASRSFVPDYLRHHVRTSMKFQATPPLLKDSRLMTDSDIDLITEYVRGAPTEHVVVTSGLLRIGKLRDRLSQTLSAGDDHDRQRKVVLTGSRHMLGTVGFSDAGFSLGFAHGVLGKVAPGVHVALTGRVIASNADPLDFAYKPEELHKIGVYHD